MQVNKLFDHQANLFDKIVKEGIKSEVCLIQMAFYKGIHSSVPSCELIFHWTYYCLSHESDFMTMPTALSTGSARDKVTKESSIRSRTDGNTNNLFLLLERQ